MRRLSRIVNFLFFNNIRASTMCQTLVDNEDTEINKTDVALALKNVPSKKGNKHLNH